MKIRALDQNGDFSFGKGKQNYRAASDAIAQDVQTKLQQFLGEAFWDTEAGVDWINLMRSKNKQNQIALSCRAVMLKANGVIRVNQVSVSYSEASRGLVISYNMDTVYSRNFTQTVSVQNT